MQAPSLPKPPPVWPFWVLHGSGRTNPELGVGQRGGAGEGRRKREGEKGTQAWRPGLGGEGLVPLSPVGCKELLIATKRGLGMGEGAVARLSGAAASLSARGRPGQPALLM